MPLETPRENWFLGIQAPCQMGLGMCREMLSNRQQVHRGDCQLLQRAGEVSIGHYALLGSPPPPPAAPGAEAARQLLESQDWFIQGCLPLEREASELWLDQPRVLTHHWRTTLTAQAPQTFKMQLRE